MSAIITTLQLIVLVLCLYGELTRKIKSTPLVTVALGAIFVGTLISMSRTDAGSPVESVILWAGIASLIAWVLRELMLINNNIGRGAKQ